MKPSSAKAKGRKNQQTVRDSILEHFQELTLNDVRSTGMGQSGTDIQLSEAALKKFPYSIECKHRAKIAIYTDWEQTKANTLPGTEPALIIKANRKEELAVISLKHFMELVSGKAKKAV